MNVGHLWGKRFEQQGATATHPLVCHMIDVAELAGALWDLSTSPGMLRPLAPLGAGQQQDMRLLGMFWAALHDLGKATPAFQRQCPQALPLVRAAGLTFAPADQGGDAWHALLSAWALTPLLEANGVSPALATRITRALAGHHGGWPPADAQEALTPELTGGDDWDEARAELVALLARLYQPPANAAPLPQREARQAALFLLAGVTSLANWLASTETWLAAMAPAWHELATPTPARLEAALAAYRERARALAVDAVRRAGLARWPEPAEAPRFEALFDGLAPNGLQQAAIELAPQLSGPGVVLIEAPSGAGKTEAALYLAAHTVHARQAHGLLVAAPATAADGRLHERVAAMLRARYGEAQAEQLVHGQARWDGPPERIWQAMSSDLEGADGVEVMGWFLPAKRALLAPFGMTSSDEVLLGVTSTRHHFVRLAGLAERAVILDQVHANSAQASLLLPRAVDWLRAMGCVVIVLSTGLPAEARRALLLAGGADEDAAAALASASAPYPSITWACRHAAGGELRLGCVEAPVTGAGEVALERLSAGEGALVATLSDALAQGGCAAVVCHSVARAQAVYEALRAAQAAPDGELALLHELMTLQARRRTEQGLMARYGPGAPAQGRRGIVVGTQRLASGLDLDFDLVATDPAPVDLLLRTAGLLHRHARAGRPAPVSAPRLLLLSPAQAAGRAGAPASEPAQGGYRRLRTRLALERRARLRPVEDTRALLEAVYGSDAPLGGSAGHGQALSRAHNAWLQTSAGERAEAQWLTLKAVGLGGVFGQVAADPVAEHVGVRLSLATLMREAPQGLTLICLHMNGREIALSGEGGEPFDISAPPDAAATERLLDCSLQITDAGLMQALSEFAPPTVWREHPLLRHCRLALFTRGVWHVPGTEYTLRLARPLGLKIQQRRG